MKRTTEPLRKLAPSTVRVNPPVPTIAAVGERLLIAGAGLSTEKANIVDVPPPGAGLVTATGNVPPVATSDAKICAVSCELLMSVVARANPLKLTTELALKFVPSTMRVNEPVPRF